MIKGLDGAPYSVSGSLNVFNSNPEDRALLNEIDAEIIRINGTPIFYYEIMIDSNSIDPLYREARGAIFSQDPIQIYAYYDPITSQNYQNMFGIDSLNMVTFELNYDAVVQAIGHMPLVGSRLFTPHRAENWEIIQRGSSDWKIWSQIRMVLECRQFQESTTRGDGKITQNNPLPYQVN